MSYKLLNLACGSKISKVGDWANLDFKSPLSNVRECNILKGLDYQDNYFDVVYSAQFIEHLEINDARNVLLEVSRVLKPGGFIRLVTPDMEELAKSYLKFLSDLNCENNKIIEEKYDWIRLEIFDQIVRSKSGGEIYQFYSKCNEETKGFIIDRLGYSGKKQFQFDNTINKNISLSYLLKNINKIPKKLIAKALEIVLPKKIKKINFIESGEIHKYMHDFYSLSRLLNESKFINIKRAYPEKSSIPEWSKYGLDVIDNIIDGPLSLYIEAQSI